MREAAGVLKSVVAAGFLLVAFGAYRRWRSRPARADALIAAAVGLLALVAVLGRLGELTEGRYPTILDVSVVAFAASGYLLLGFRHEFLPLPRAVRAVALAAAGAAAGAVISRRLDYGPGARYGGADAAALACLVGVWAVEVIEPCARFWLASRRRPPVQRARLRALTVAFAGILVILAVGASLGPGTEPEVDLGLQAAALAVVPLLHLAISPPAWMRRLWRAPEEEALRASRHLVMFAPDRRTLSSRALEWAVRLVGGDAGFLATHRGDVVTEIGMAHDEACEQAARIRPPARAAALRVAGKPGVAIAAPVPTQAGTGVLAVFSGPFTALFGSEETERLGEYAVEVGVALDRVHLTEEMRRLDETRRAFIANAAHELRTPLTAILGFSSMVANDPAAMPPEQLRQAMDAVHRNALRMRTLADNLLDLSQIEAGKLAIAVEPVPLAEVVRATLERTPPPEDRCVSVDVSDVLVLADRLRLEQALVNLLVNAYRYGGTNIAVRAHRDSGSVVVTVTDDGLGIKEPLRSRLFEPFARGAAVGREGSGLGLAISRSLVRAFGGDMWYEDAEPHGARFALRLERAPEP